MAVAHPVVPPFRPAAPAVATAVAIMAQAIEKGDKHWKHRFMALNEMPKRLSYSSTA